MFTIGKIRQIYETCLNWAVLWLNHNGYRVNTSGSVIPEPNNGDVVMRMADTLHCIDWPFRNGSSKKIDILATIAETISLKEGICTKAVVCVNYFKIDGNKAIATESLHYDYVCPPQAKHPLCHVQGMNDVLDTPESFRHEVNSDWLKCRYHNVRIPSAFVNLPGLLAILAADHMRVTQWQEFMTEWQQRCAKFPRMKKHAAIEKAIEDGQVYAWAWYEI